MATLTIFLIIIAAISAEAGKSKHEDQAESIYDELFAIGRFFFAKENPGLPAHEVHNKLVTLSQLYSTRTDRTLRKRKREIDDLVETRNIHPSKCNEGYFVDLESFIDDYRSIPRILSYLKDTKLMLFKVCDVKYRANLEKDLNDLSREEIDDVLRIYQDLMKGSFRGRVDFHFGKIPPDAIAEALVKFLINKPDPSNSSGELRVGHKLDYKYELRRIVFDVCENVKFSAQNTLRFYEQLLDDEDLRDDFDTWVIEWTTSMKMCKIARDNFDIIENRVLNYMSLPRYN